MIPQTLVTKQQREHFGPINFPPAMTQTLFAELLNNTIEANYQ